MVREPSFMDPLGPMSLASMDEQTHRKCRRAVRRSIEESIDGESIGVGFFGFEYVKTSDVRTSRRRGYDFDFTSFARASEQ